MAMIVQHNMTAMNTNRQLGISTNALSKSTEKLSSGYRINLVQIPVHNSVSICGSCMGPVCRYIYWCNVCDQARHLG